MRTLTLRSSAIRPTEREAVKMRVPEPLYDRGQHLPSKGQKVVLPRRHILRCYYYAKSARGKWVSAERAISGSRWNWYMCRGRTTPKVKPPEVQKIQVSDGKMKEIEVKKGKKRALEKEMENGTNAQAEMRSARTRVATTEAGTADGTPHSFLFRNPTTRTDTNLFSSFIFRSPGTHVGNPDNGTAGTTTNRTAFSRNRAPPSTMGSGSEAEGTEVIIGTLAKSSVVVMPRTIGLRLLGAESCSSESSGTNARMRDSPAAGFKTATRNSATRTASADTKIEFFAGANRTKANGDADGAVDGGIVRGEWSTSNGPGTITGNPGKGVGYIGSWRKKEFQLKVTNACAEPE